MTNHVEPARRTYVDDVTDSARWSAFVPRTGDIVVSTPPKSGTTWTQGILALLLSGDPEVDAQTSMKSPWIDIKFRDLNEVMARLEAQDHRRHVKTHTPFDGIPYWPDLRYITVYRHPIDVHFSFLRHTENRSDTTSGGAATEGHSAAFRRFLVDADNHAGLPMLLDHYRCTLAREPRENLIRMHYADMLCDLPGAMDRVAGHIGIAHPPEVMAALVKAATFDSMQANAHRFTPSAGQGFWKDDARFFDSASSNKWLGKLTADDLAAYDAQVDAVLSPQERAWLEWGNRMCP